MRSSRLAAHEFALPAGVAGAARGLARAEAVDLSTVLLAAFAALLHRYTGEAGLVVGMAGAGEADMVPVRFDLSGRPSFRELLVRLDRTAAAEARLDGTLRVGPDGLGGAFEYRADRFAGERTGRMAEHLVTLLAGATASPDRPVGGLRMLGDRELDLVTRAWNRTEVARPDLCLHEPFEAWARRTPDAVAVEQDGRTLTYGELDRRAGRLAASLRALGVGPEVSVALACERAPETMTGLLAVLKAGGAYVPADPESPPARQAELLRDSGARVVLTLSRLRRAIPAPEGIPVLCLDEPPPGARADGPPARPSNLVYLIYTSGSTGRPKGVLNQHGPVCNRLLWMLEHHPLETDDAVLQKTPLHFDVSVWEMFWPLSSGARLVLARPGGHRDAAYLVRTVAASRVTALHFVPSMLAAFLEQPDLGGCAGLTHVYCSGEALTPALRERVFERLPVELHNLYGPTETAIEVSHWRCRPDDAAG
ncbi:MAG TPA: AMP-binding protein, partial [Candidatus Eisenbacteria bacterium]|nr:AMP-binding protein [Candidatus Eisenbacteria bacterium]